MREAAEQEAKKQKKWFQKFLRETLDDFPEYEEEDLLDMYEYSEIH